LWIAGALLGTIGAIALAGFCLRAAGWFTHDAGGNGGAGGNGRSRSCVVRGPM